MSSESAIVSSAGGATDSATTPSMQFPFSFDNAMDDFKGWAADTATRKESAMFSGSNPLQPVAGPCGYGEPAHSTAGEDSGYNFLFNMGGFAAPTAAISAEGALNSSFPTIMPEAPDNDADTFSFDFASFFLSREEQKGDGDEVANRPVHARLCAEGDAPENHNSRPPPSLLFNQSGPIRQVDESKQGDHAGRSTNASQDAPKESKTTRCSGNGITTSTPLSHQTTVETRPLDSVAPSTVCAADTAQVRSKDNAPRPHVPSKASAWPPFSELTLSAALAAASSAPENGTARSSTQSKANSIPAAVGAVDWQENEDEEHCKSDARRDGPPARDFSEVGGRDAEGSDETKENEECGRETCAHEASTEAINRDAEEQCASVPAASAARDALADAPNMRQPAARNAVLHPMGKHPLYTEDTYPSAAPLPREPPRVEYRIAPTDAAQDASAPVSTSSAVLSSLIADAQRVCACAAEVETGSCSNLPSLSSRQSPSGISSTRAHPHLFPRGSNENAAMRSVVGAEGGPPADDKLNASDAVFFAEAAQLQRQSARLSEETAKSAALFQSQTSDFLCLLSPHAGLAGCVGEAYAATPVVHLMPFVISVLEDLLKEDPEGEAEEGRAAEDALCLASLSAPSKGVPECADGNCRGFEAAKRA
ncbi:hypothetical protein ABL78_1369 [Leptomonas seymouri]|uniref:Uncharacterized protein n=1 Tax=Leptomonas seymouri TaxID=5684 RepID=A0A0N1PEW6_LEPSE|nr:hypothetical protein ABL78_1369 [Leptomonas seymouri]|eukprot:KPI89493.1 hypothetical protein ABL78_1369 [Leptomonas seymouri]